MGHHSREWGAGVGSGPEWVGASEPSLSTPPSSQTWMEGDKQLRHGLTEPPSPTTSPLLPPPTSHPRPSNYPHVCLVKNPRAARSRLVGFSIILFFFSFLQMEGPSTGNKAQGSLSWGLSSGPSLDDKGAEPPGEASTPPSHPLPKASRNFTGAKCISAVGRRRGRRLSHPTK